MSYSIAKGGDLSQVKGSQLCWVAALPLNQNFLKGGDALCSNLKSAQCWIIQLWADYARQCLVPAKRAKKI